MPFSRCLPADVLIHWNGDTKLSEHFWARELWCSDGSPFALVHPTLVEGLERLRTICGAPVIVTSGFRTGAHNRHIGGADDSAHLYGMAADVRVVGRPTAEVAHAALQLEFGGIGLYSSWVHVDVRGKDRRWGF